MQQGSFHEVPWRYLFREEEAGTRRAGRRECSTTTKGDALGTEAKLQRTRDASSKPLPPMAQSYVLPVTSPQIIY